MTSRNEFLECQTESIKHLQSPIEDGYRGMQPIFQSHQASSENRSMVITASVTSFCDFFRI